VVVGLERLIPLDTPKRKKRVAKSQPWSREKREELSKMAEAFLKAKTTNEDDAA